MLGGAGEAGQRLARFPCPAVPRVPTTACGKGLDVLWQLEAPPSAWCSLYDQYLL